MIKLSILDFGAANSFQESHITIERTINDVQLADKLGFNRYWLGEHYENPMSWHNPNILIGVLASITDDIKIGSAGILIKLHSLLKIAEDYRMLSFLFPNRIDLGIAAGKPDIEIIRELLNENDYNYNVLNYNERVITLNKYMSNGSYNNNNNIIPPYMAEPTKMWLLGKGGTENFALSEKVNANYCLSMFHAKVDNDKIKI